MNNTNINNINPPSTLALSCNSSSIATSSTSHVDNELFNKKNYLFSSRTEKEIQSKLEKASRKWDCALAMCANEPSVGLYRVQEHVRRTTPRLIHQADQYNELKQQIEGRNHDVQYAVTVADTMYKIKSFAAIFDSASVALRAQKNNNALDGEIRKLKVENNNTDGAGGRSDTHGMASSIADGLGMMKTFLKQKQQQQQQK
eukprot:Nk52_evm7s24 gene=Nk52_evmTU7s24